MRPSSAELAPRVSCALFRVRVPLLAVVALALGAAVTLHPGPASAATDLSGSWDTNYALSCSAVFAQNGTDLSADVDCGGGVSGTLDGTIAGDGSFTMSGFFSAVVFVEVTGDVTSDGSSFSGTFSAPPFVESGPFSGVREGPGDADDLSGNWNVIVDGIFSGDCTANVQQTGSSVIVDTDCGAIQHLEGTYDDSTRQVVLQAPDVLNGTLTINGTVSQDGNHIDGTWMIDDGKQLAISGIFAGTRLVSPTPTDVAIATQVATEPAATQDAAAATVTPSLTLPAAGGGSGGSGWSLAAVWIGLIAASGLAAVSWLVRRHRQVSPRNS